MEKLVVKWSPDFEEIAMEAELIVHVHQPYPARR